METKKPKGRIAIEHSRFCVNIRGHKCYRIFKVKFDRSNPGKAPKRIPETRVFLGRDYRDFLPDAKSQDTYEVHRVRNKAGKHELLL